MVGDDALEGDPVDVAVEEEAGDAADRGEVPVEHGHRHGRHQLLQGNATNIFSTLKPRCYSFPKGFLKIIECMLLAHLRAVENLARKCSLTEDDGEKVAVVAPAAVPEGLPAVRRKIFIFFRVKILCC